MRIRFALIGLLLFSFASAAAAGMRLTLVMVSPQEIQRLARDETAIARLVLEPKADSVLELDKEWHGIHFLLNGNAWSTRGPYGKVILGGKEIGGDLGYGPARVLTPSEVADIATRLKSVSVDQLRRRYDPHAMMKAQVYPEVWEREGLEAYEWLVTGYRQLVNFYVRAAEQRKAVILAII